MKPWLLLPAMLALAPFSLRATDNYTYGPTEYVTITDGQSPDGKYAITAHGEGDLGYDNFHLFLFDARTGKRIGPLEEIGGNLDTGAGSFCTLWSRDSGQVSIFYRVDRHAPIKEMTYRIAKGRAFPLTPAPVDVTHDYAWYWSQHCSSRHTSGKTYGKSLQK
jgi:hypothetical protein